MPSAAWEVFLLSAETHQRADRQTSGKELPSKKGRFPISELEFISGILFEALKAARADGPRIVHKKSKAVWFCGEISD